MTNNRGRRARGQDAVRVAQPIRNHELAPAFLASLRRLGVDDAELQILNGKGKRRRPRFS